MDLLTPNIGLILWQLFIFLGLFFILRKFAWKGILSALKDRNNEIDSALRMAEETRAEMAKLKADNDKLIVEAKLERDQIIKEAREASNNLVSKAKENATIEGARILQDARDSINQEKVAMLAQARKDVATLSIEIAEKVLKKELSNKDSQEKLVSDLMADIKLN